MIENLRSLVPQSEAHKPLKIDETLLFVVQRIAEVLPAEKVWEYFVSDPTQAGGRGTVLRFPYLRLDACFYGIHDKLALYSIYMKKEDLGKMKSAYKKASEYALRALLWIDVGFEGFEKYAVSSHTSNWNVGVDAETRALEIKTMGRRIFDERLGEFKVFRDMYPERNSDCFAEYHLEELLDRVG